MGNCCNFCKFYQKQQKNITLLMIGLDDAGKTTVTKKLAGEPTDSVLKTLGFSLIILHHHGYKIQLYDLGGSLQIRDIWNKYFMDAHGVIFMVDASNETRLDEARLVFANLISHSNISGKPILLLANKQDKEQALDELEIVEHLNVEYVVNKYQCLTRVVACSAFGEPSKIDSGIKNGFRWLVNCIIQNYKTLNERVNHDMAEYDVLVQKSKDEWKKRIKLNEDDCENETNFENGNPFQPVDTYLKRTNENGVPKVRNGVGKTVLVDNFVKSEITTNQTTETFDRLSKTDRQIALQVTMIKNVVDEQKNKLSRRYHRHKKKFRRFNRIAPLPIDLIMRVKSTNVEEQRQTSNYSVKSCLTSGIQKNNKLARSFLSRRPATAPPKLNFPVLKVKAAWDLSTPPVVTTSASKSFVPRLDISDSEDVSYF